MRFRQPVLPVAYRCQYPGGMNHVVGPIAPVRWCFNLPEPKVTIVRAKPPAPPWYRFSTEIARVVDWDHVFEVAQNILKAMFRKAAPPAELTESN